ncbi:glutaminase [Streptomyces sparsus]
MDYLELLNKSMDTAKPVLGRGMPADYIPALACADPYAFGMALATVEGEVHGVGEWRTPFSIQSISKVFTLALALAHGGSPLWQRVGREPSGNPFNSLIQLESEQGVPRNPFINAGALVVTDALLTLTGDARGAVVDLLRRESGSAGIDTDAAVAASEAAHGHRNAALAHFMASFGNLHNPVDDVLQHYFEQCSVAADCRDLAMAGCVLARHGVRADGTRLLGRGDAKRINAVLLTCGTYDAAGEFAYRVGLPGKSGVGGGILAIVPGRGAVCAWSPGLDPVGNSVGAMAALEDFTHRSDWSVF